MSDASTNLMLPYLQPAQAQKHVTLNETLLRLDALVQGAAESRLLAAQPVSPVDGARYILPPGKTGTAWGAMADHAIAYWRDGVWEAIPPRSGFRLFVRDEAMLVAFDGAGWRPVGEASPNLLINGGFGVWQRGTSFPSVAAGAYLADRWRAGGAGLTASRAADAPPGAAFSLEVSAGAGAWSIGQRVESQACLAVPGARVTAAFWAKSLSGSGAMSVSVACAGAPDNFASMTGLQSRPVPGLDGDWRRFDVAFDALPAAAANGVELVVSRAAPGGGVRIALAQLHVGAFAPDFMHVPPATEIALCQRFFEKSHNLAIAPGNAPGAGNCAVSVGAPAASAYATLAFKVSKRVAPVFSVLDGAGTAGKISYYDTAWRNGGAPTVATANEAGYFVQGNVGGSLIVNFDWTANAEL